jgi:hypothetical protein
MIELRRATMEDRPQIVRLCADLFDAPTAAALDRLWVWQWEQDPRLDPPGVRGNVVVDGGTILGSMTFIPAGLFIDGSHVGGSWGSVAMVHQGMLRKAMRRMRDEQRSAAQGAKADADRRGWATRLVTHQRETEIGLGKHLAANMFNETQKIGCGFVAGTGYWFRRLSMTQAARRFVGPFAAPLLTAVPNAVLMRLPRGGGQVQVMPGDFDARFNELWEHARLAYPAITRRDARLLQWRYRRRPDASYTVLTLEDGGFLRGYAVIRTFLAGRMVRGKIVDLLARLDDAAARRELLAASLHALRDMGADKALCYATHETLIAALRETGFAPQPLADPLAVQNLPDVRPYVTEGDGDGA